MPHETMRSVTREAILAEAMTWAGTPYVHQASCKGGGCDCLGLVRGVYRRFRPEPVNVPAYSPSWADAGAKEHLLDAAGLYLEPVDPGQARPGDVVLFRYKQSYPAKHAGILIDADRFLHAQHGCAVTPAALCSWWRRHIAGVFKFPFVLD